MPSSHDFQFLSDNFPTWKSFLINLKKKKSYLPNLQFENFMIFKYLIHIYFMDKVIYFQIK